MFHVEARVKIRLPDANEEFFLFSSLFHVTLHEGSALARVVRILPRSPDDNRFRSKCNTVVIVGVGIVVIVAAGIVVVGVVAVGIVAVRIVIVVVDVGILPVVFAAFVDNWEIFTYAAAPLVSRIAHRRKMLIKWDVLTSF